MLSETCGVDRVVSEPYGVDCVVSEPCDVDRVAPQPCGVDQVVSEPCGVDCVLSETCGVDYEVCGGRGSLLTDVSPNRTVEQGRISLTGVCSWAGEVQFKMSRP